MGIRFRCHHCEKQLHVKDFQAGKRGKCPKCKASFRIPEDDADYSLSLEPAGQEMVAAASHTSSDSQSFSNKASADLDEALGLDAPSDFDAANDLPDTISGQEPEREQVEPLRMQPVENEWSQEASPPQEPTQKQPTAPAFWYVRPPSGGQFGPADQEVFEQWLTENRVTADSLVWRDGWEEWLPAAEAMPEAFPALQTGSSSSKSPARLEPIATAPESSQPSLGEKNRLERKQKRKRNYKVMLGVLIVLTLVLLSALIVAILNQ